MSLAIWDARTAQLTSAQAFYNGLNALKGRLNGLAANTDFEMGGGAVAGTVYNLGKRDEDTNKFSFNHFFWLAFGEIVVEKAAKHGLSAVIGSFLADRGYGALPAVDDPAALNLGIHTNVDQTRTFLQNIVHPITGKDGAIPLLAGYAAILTYGQFASFAPGIDREFAYFGWVALRPRSNRTLPSVFGSYKGKAGVRFQANVSNNLIIE
jgi:hypothetical protein